VLRPTETQRVAGLRREARVSPELTPFVERYWSVRWDRTGQPPFRSEVLSHPSVNVSVESGSHPRFGYALPAVLVHGMMTRRFVVDLVGAGRVTAVKFRPGGWVAFGGRLPARGSVVPLGGDLGLDPSGLLAAVLAEEDDDARAAVLDRTLAPLAPEPADAYLELQALLERMLDDRSLVRVEQVARAAAMSTRSLQRLFAGYVGLSPKAVLARYRLQDAAAAIDAGEAPDLAALAAELGWFDQAHFSRDFRAVVGTTPSAYLQRARAALDGRVPG
jgi:AraC-like DNA-binding protein